MDYYVSWTHSDPIYQQYLENVRALVSPPNVNRTWHPSDWVTLPNALILDSGAYQYHREGRSPDPAAVLERQLQMVANLTIPVGICHLDVPLPGTRNLAELERRVEQNLVNARWLIQRAQQLDLPSNIRLIGVIQGATSEQIYSVACVLAELGYQSFALGSLARMVAYAKDELLRRVESALEAIGSGLHVLGVSSAPLLPELRRIGVESADSGAPIHEAWRGGVFYSHPFRRYKIESPYFKEWQRSYSFAELLSSPLPCACPVCQQDSSQLLQPQGKKFVNLRAIHNYYHLVQELGSST